MLYANGNNDVRTNKLFTQNQQNIKHFKQNGKKKLLQQKRK